MWYGVVDCGCTMMPKWFILMSTNYTGSLRECFNFFSLRAYESISVRVTALVQIQTVASRMFILTVFIIIGYVVGACGLKRSKRLKTCCCYKASCFSILGRRHFILYREPSWMFRFLLIESLWKHFCTWLLLFKSKPDCMGKSRLFQRKWKSSGK